MQEFSIGTGLILKHGVLDNRTQGIHIMFMTLSEKEEVAILRMSKMAETGGDLALIILIFARNIAKKIDQYRLHWV